MGSVGPGGGGGWCTTDTSPKPQAVRHLPYLPRDHLHSHAKALRDNQDVAEDDGTIQLRIPVHRLEG